MGHSAEHYVCAECVKGHGDVENRTGEVALSVQRADLRIPTGCFERNTKKHTKIGYVSNWGSNWCLFESHPKRGTEPQHEAKLASVSSGAMCFQTLWPTRLALGACQTRQNQCPKVDYCGWTKSISHRLRNHGMMRSPCKIPTILVVSHGCKVG